MSLRDPDGSYICLPLDQTRWNSVLLVRTEGNPAALLPVLGSAVRRLDAPRVGQ
jgi:hypothetical protein